MTKRRRRVTLLLLLASAISLSFHSITRVISLESGEKTGVAWQPDAIAHLSLQSPNKRENSPPPRPHPHAGARFPNGTWGYIANVTLVRSWIKESFQKTSKTLNDPPISYLPFVSSDMANQVCNTPPKDKNGERKAGWRLLQKISVKGNLNKPNHQSTDSKILCAIYTYEKQHDAVTAIGETWGWRCDGFFAASTKTVLSPFEPGFGAIDLTHEGPEMYENMWNKVRSIWSYIHDHYIDDYDFFFLSGFDTHVILENLRLLLDRMGQSAKQYPLYLGHWIPDSSVQRGFFCGGGPGYVLNKVSLRILVQDVLPKCLPNLQTHAEDRSIGYCFRKFAGIVGNKSVDTDGRQTFHGMDPHFVAHYKGDKGYFKDIYKFWGKEFGGFKFGEDIVSNQSVSFHLLKNSYKLKRHHAILYKSCPKGTVLGDIFE